MLSENIEILLLCGQTSKHYLGARNITSGPVKTSKCYFRARVDVKRWESMCLIRPESGLKLHRPFRLRVRDLFRRDTRQAFGVSESRRLFGAPFFGNAHRRAPPIIPFCTSLVPESGSPLALIRQPRTLTRHHTQWIKLSLEFESVTAARPRIRGPPSRK